MSITFPNPHEGNILLLGMPRSGTTWIGKIFDSHPDVLYRHEPDMDVRNYEFPMICSREDAHSDKFRSIAAGYLHTLANTKTLRVAGSLPVFKKNYHGSMWFGFRAILIWLLHIADQMNGTRRLVGSWKIPDLICPGGELPRLVMKSNTSLGRVRLFANVLPGSHIVVIIRDPRAQVASVLRGQSSGKFERITPAQAVMDIPQFRRYNVTEKEFNSLSPAEQLAWNWAILNEKTLEDVDGIENVTILKYDEFVGNPLVHARHLFHSVGLEWHRNTEKFIQRSSRDTSWSRYYGVHRSANQALFRWRSELSADQQRGIMQIVAQTPLAALGF